MLVKDDWVKMAMENDKVVAELLLRLKQAHALTLIKSTMAENRLPPPRWGVRQPRTRLAFRYDVASPAKGGDSRRNSPTTPLSWSGGTTSSSGTADGSDDSDMRGYGFSRSKGNDSRFPSTTFNKPRRKKSFDRLTEEETLMLSGGRAQLKENKLANYKDQRDISKSLKKRMKLDFAAEIHKSTSAFATAIVLSSSGSLTLHQHHEEALEPIQERERTGFVLPDLNEPYSELMT